jgi:two-component system NtrC family sensor kinase
MSIPRSPRKGSLTRRTLLHVALGVAVVIGISSSLSYLLLREELQQHARERLSEYVIGRADIESDVFVLARDMQQAVRRKVIDTYPSALNADSLARFDELFVKYPDGSLRSPVERFGNGETVTGCIPRGTRLTEEFRQRIVLFHEILEQFKVSALLRFADIFITAPEQAMLGTDPPSLPQWCRVVAADFDLSGEIWEQLASRESNPTRGTFWSRIAFEPVWKNFLASVGTPIDVDGVHIGTIFNDLLLDDLVENLLRNGLPGAQQCIFQDDGYLIAHTARMPEIIASQGQLTLLGSGDPALAALFAARASVTGPPSAASISGYDATSDHYYALSRIEGPGWYFAAMMPGDLMRGQALRAARWVSWMGLVSLGLLVLLLATILRRQIALPLRGLTVAAERLGAGQAGVVPFEHGRDEIGRLAQAFNAMVAKLADRDLALQRERELSRQRDRLVAMGGLLAGVAHELNNPLAVVVGRSIMLEQSASDPPVCSDAQKIRSAAERCVRIVKTFLAMARQRDQDTTRARIADIIVSALEVLDYSLRMSDIQVVLDVPDELPDLYADVDQLHQVFMNLFVNAQHALADAPRPRELRIVARQCLDPGKLEVAVSDSGPRTPTEICARVSDPYLATHGSSVGLSVSLGIVEAHQGTLVDQSAPGCGTRFLLTLPLGARARGVTAERAPTGAP